MARVTAMKDYCERRRAARGMAPPAAQKPEICDADIWGRDYSKLENVVFGVLKVVEVMEYYLYDDEVWPRLVLRLLDRGYRVRNEGFEELIKAAREVKTYLAEQTDYENDRLILGSILILDFIEKWPAHRLKNPKPESEEDEMILARA